MRTLRRNQQKFFYQNRTGREPIIDEWGNETGEYEYVYGDIETAYANISAAKGELNFREFGESEDYERVLVAVDLPINEDTRLWLDVENTSKPHNYVVAKIARSLNNLAVAVKAVEVS